MSTAGAGGAWWATSVTWTLSSIIESQIYHLAQVWAKSQYASHIIHSFFIYLSIHSTNVNCAPIVNIPVSLA